MKLISLQLRFDTGMMVSWKIAQQEDLQKPNLRKSIAHFSHMVIQPRSQRKLFLLTVYLTHLRWLTFENSQYWQVQAVCDSKQTLEPAPN